MSENKSTKNPYNAIRNGNIGTLRKQLNEGLSVNEKGGLLLIVAIQSKNLEAVEELLKRGANPNLYKPSPLEVALIYRVDSTITRALLKAGAKILADHMFLAAEKGNIPNMEALIEYGGNVNQEEEILERIRNPLTKAIRANQKNMAEFLIKKGAKMPPEYVNTESYESRFYKTMMESLKGGRKTRRSKRSARKTRRRI